MLTSGKKIILTLLSEKIFLNETKNQAPPPLPLQVKWSVPYYKSVGFF